jgi:IS5 family transposase
MFRTSPEQVSAWEAALLAEVMRLPDELARIHGLLDNPVFPAPFARFFDPPRSVLDANGDLPAPVLKFRFRLGYESLCREVADSISRRRFCRRPRGPMAGFTA